MLSSAVVGAVCLSESGESYLGTNRKLSLRSPALNHSTGFSIGNWGRVIIDEYPLRISLTKVTLNDILHLGSAKLLYASVSKRTRLYITLAGGAPKSAVPALS